MKQLPILFSTAMVQAILEGRKSQTRRIVKPQPIARNGRWDFAFKNHIASGARTEEMNTRFLGLLNHARYQPSDTLYVRETWALPVDSDGSDAGYQYRADYVDGSEDWKWRPSIHMPKAAARIWLRVKDVRVERLQDISEEDAVAEGIIKDSFNSWPFFNYLDRAFKSENAIQSYATLIDSIHGHGTWEANPWVWVYDFEVISTTGKPQFSNQ